MLVKDLIARLRELDPEMRVVMPRDDTPDMSEVDGAFVDMVALSPTGLQLSDERDADREPVVRLFGPD